ncbi:MAG: hypothetical protein HYZ49_11935 [Chloroflexi bacterium]|nr:hypothetical protein [Chloroflexota bacterium]
MLARFRRLPGVAWLSLAVSLAGLLAEATYHFLPPQSIPAYASWLAGLSAVDRDFFGMVYELIAHIFIGLGLTGLVSLLVYQQIKSAERSPNGHSTAPK